MDMIYKII